MNYVMSFCFNIIFFNFLHYLEQNFERQSYAVTEIEGHNFTQYFHTLLEKVFFFSFGFRSSTEKVSKMLAFQAQIMICS
jgi:hypothetical protein